MFNQVKRKLSGLMAGILMASSVFGLTAFGAEGDKETVTINGFTLERYSDTSTWTSTASTNAWTVVAFDGTTTNAVIPDAIQYLNGEATENQEYEVVNDPDTSGCDPDTGLSVVCYIKEDVYDQMNSVVNLQLPKYLSSSSALSASVNNINLQKLTNLESFTSNNTGTGPYYTYNGVLYRYDSTYDENALVQYPLAKTGDYTIKEGTDYAWERAFIGAYIGTLTIPEGFEIDDYWDEEGEQYVYTFLCASIDYYEGANCTDGAVFSEDGSRLIAYGNEATADLSNITEANPYAFHSEDVLNSVTTLSDTVLTTVPFAFYSGQDIATDGSTLGQTRYFSINGQTAYCYDYGKKNPETVGEISDYDEEISSEDVIFAVKAILYAGYPYDAFDLLDSTGVDLEAAKNITGSLVWEAVDDVEFTLDDIYGITDMDAADDYLTQLRMVIETVTESDVENMDLGFYSSDGSSQGLIVATIQPYFYVSKQAVTGTGELPGATLTITNSEEKTVATWVSTSTPHKVIGLADGAYTLTETNAPDGYGKAESISFTIEDGVVKDDADNTVVMYDKRTVTISKQEITSQEELPGAELTITKDGDTEPSYSWTSTDEPYVIENMPDGTYTLKEVTAPEGYSKAESITFTVTDGVVEDDEDNVIVMYDKQAVTISKQDITSEEELPGAELTITKNGETEPSYSWTSTDEPYVIENMPDGTYTLKEVTAPEGYSKAESITFTVTDGVVEDDEDNVIVMYDKQAVTISKQDITSEEELPGAELTITKDGDTEPSYSWTSTDEPYVIENMPDGTYTLTEVTAPEGYEKAESITFTVTDGVVEDDEDNMIVMYDAETTYVMISKQDISGTKELPGAELTITKEGATEPDYSWTSTDEPYVIENMPDGTYTLTEVTAPEGYEKAESITFTITDGVVEEYDDNTVIMYDAETTYVMISKQDISGTKELPGAELTITEEGETEPSYEWTSSDEPYVIENMPDGTYTLTEVTAPEGYEKAESITFTITDGIVEEYDDNTVIMYDAPESTVIISKRDITNEDELPGAELIIIDEEDQIVYQWTSTDEPYEIKDMPDGTYTLTEVTAPDGYEKAESITFTVENGTVENGIVVMYDSPSEEKEPGYIYISKRDAETGKELSGAKLQIEDENGDVVESWTTDGSVHKMEALIDGDYTLVEVKAPSGYKVANSISFTIIDWSVESTIVMYDEKASSSNATPSDATPSDATPSDSTPDKEEETPTETEEDTPVETEEETTTSSSSSSRRHSSGGSSGSSGGSGTTVTTPTTETTETTDDTNEENSGNVTADYNSDTDETDQGNRKPVKTDDIMNGLLITAGILGFTGVWYVTKKKISNWK